MKASEKHILIYHRAIFFYFPIREISQCALLPAVDFALSFQDDLRWEIYALRD